MLLLGRSSMFMDMVRPSMPVKLKNRRNNGRRVAPEAAMSPSPGSEVDHCGGCQTYENCSKKMVWKGKSEFSNSLIMLEESLKRFSTYNSNICRCKEKIVGNLQHSNEWDSDDSGNTGPTYYQRRLLIGRNQEGAYRSPKESNAAIDNLFRLSSFRCQTKAIGNSPKIQSTKKESPEQAIAMSGTRAMLPQCPSSPRYCFQKKFGGEHWKSMMKKNTTEDMATAIIVVQMIHLWTRLTLIRKRKMPIEERTRKVTKVQMSSQRYQQCNA